MIDPVVVAAEFATRSLPVAAQRVMHGHIHDTFVVTCNSLEDAADRILLQRLNAEVFRDLDALASNRVRITDHLRRQATGRGVPPIVAEPIATRSGGPMHVDATGATWRATEFVARTRVLGPDATTDDLRAAARAFAELAGDLDGLPPPDLVETIPRFHDFAWRRANLETAIEGDPVGRMCGAADLIALSYELADRVERELAAMGSQVDDLPTRFVHNDAKLDNVLVDSTTGAVACIVDLDTVMAGTALNDFGELARTAATTAPEDEPDLTKIQLDRTRFRALAHGYVAGARSFMLDSERDCLALAGPLLTLENAVRFLTDHLDGDVYFRIHRPGHNAQRARAQLRVAELMLDRLPELRATITASAS